MKVVAEDWHEELRDYPAWAILKASRWWMSSDNPERRKKPLAGDISARAKKVMAPVAVAEHALRRFEAGKGAFRPTPKPVERVSKEAASEIMARAGMNPKVVK